LTRQQREFEQRIVDLERRLTGTQTVLRATMAHMGLRGGVTDALDASGCAPKGFYGPLDAAMEEIRTIASQLGE
jgi:hypothetical protein